jgi:hypothetical protein
MAKTGRVTENDHKNGAYHFTGNGIEFQGQGDKKTCWGFGAAGRSDTYGSSRKRGVTYPSPEAFTNKGNVEYEYVQNGKPIGYLPI